MRIERLTLLLFLSGIVATAGCSDFVTPTGKYALTHPWDAGTPVSRGTSKAEVLDVWGKPDSVRALGIDEMGIAKEEWTYLGKTNVPIDIRHFSKTKKIIFTGEYVTGWEDEAAEDGPTHY